MSMRTSMCEHGKLYSYLGIGNDKSLTVLHNRFTVDSLLGKSSCHKKHQE
jgi:hypothetical protein